MNNEPSNKPYTLQDMIDDLMASGHASYEGIEWERQKLRKDPKWVAALMGLKVLGKKKKIKRNKRRK